MRMNFNSKYVYVPQHIREQYSELAAQNNNTPTTTEVYGGSGQDLEQSYRMAAQVAVGAAIIVALAILLALIWNSLKRRLPEGNDPGMSSSASRGRYSTDSFDRLVANLMENRPPTYSPDQDKPPTYAESFFDSSSARRHSPITSSRDRGGRRHQSSNTQLPRLHERNSSQPIDQRPSTSTRLADRDSSLPSYSTAIRIVSYENQAYSEDEQQQQQSTVDIPSISMAVHRNQMSSVEEDGDNDEGIVMLHL